MLVCQYVSTWRTRVLAYSRTELQSRDSATPRPMIQPVPSCQLVPVAPTSLALVTSTLALLSL